MDAPDASPASLTTVKARLRMEYKRRRDAIPVPRRATESLALAERLFADPRVASARTAYVYRSFGSEVVTWPDLFDRMQQAGVAIFSPLPRSAGNHDFLRLALPSDNSEPVPLQIESVDLFVVPGIAWDREGYRIGYGGGFFDRLLAAARPAALIVGLAFEEQLSVIPLPREPWDFPVRLLLTPKQSIETGPGLPTPSGPTPGSPG